MRNKRFSPIRKCVAFLLSVAIVVTLIPNTGYAIYAEDNVTPTQNEQTRDVSNDAPDTVLTDDEGGAVTDNGGAVKDDDGQSAADSSSDSGEPAGGGDGQVTDDGQSGGTEADKPAGDGQTDNDKKDEITYPAASFEKNADGMLVKINAPEGALPEGTTVKVKKASKSEISEAVKDAFNKDTRVFKAVDITFYDKDGKEIEPKREVSVSFASDTFNDIQKAKVVHINDNGDVERVEGSKVDKDKNKATFKSDEFSIYAIVGEDIDYRINVVFKKGNTKIDSMYVKENDDMEVVLYDPGTGELDDGVYFRGWTTDPNYTTETEALTIDDVRTDVAGMLPPSSDDITVTYYAMLFKDYRVTYMDENNISLGQEEVTFRADSTSAQQNYKVNMAYTVQDDTHHFEGWNVKEGGSHIVGHTDGKTYENNDNITITGDVTFSVNAPEGHWFIFDENGKGATYNAPQFVQSSDHPTRPNDANMIRNGYRFGGWFKDKSVADQTSGGTHYNFNQTLSDRTTVYARWIPNTTANYTIIIWKQNLDGDGYDFEESVSLNGGVGSTINTVTAPNGTGNNNSYARVNGTNKQYKGFHLDRFDQNVKINTEETLFLTCTTTGTSTLCSSRLKCRVIIHTLQQRATMVPSMVLLTVNMFS